MTYRDIKQSELGKKSEYITTYNPEILFPISRTSKRIEIGVDPDNLPFFGVDQWTHFEVSWLNPKGKPQVAIAEIAYNCNSPYLIESKSLKLYFNSFNNTVIKDKETLQNLIMNDLSKKTGVPVTVKLYDLDEACHENIIHTLPGTCLDKLDIECTIYEVEPRFLFTEEHPVEETLYSNLLKSNCLVTYQPDWGSVSIDYKGLKINHEGLLKYLVSFRNHNEFHEQCIERIFADILTYCKPRQLTVYGRYTRRGGLDINPYRSTETLNEPLKNRRLIRQ